VARSRNIKPGFFLNDELAEVSLAGRLLFIGIWTIADREGRLTYRPRRIKATVFPYDDVDIEHEVADLVARGFLESYMIHGQPMLAVCNWHKHQKPHHKEVDSVLGGPEDADSTTENHAQVMHESSTNHAQVKQNGSCPTDSLNLIPDSLNLIPSKNGHSVTANFELFWSAYPKKRKKKSALEIWRRKKPDAPTLIADIENRLANDGQWLEGFIPDPTTYLNGERWEDELQPVTSKRKSTYAEDLAKDMRDKGML
jgi:hypothetical protein